MWNEVLQENKFRTVIRVVPTRNTDFGHLRDAWVRAITAKSRTMEGCSDESFGVALSKLKALFSKGSVPQKKELLLARNRDGALVVWYDDGKRGATRLGEVQDERISRVFLMHYLAGKTVASETARHGVVDSLMEYVERPVGTVAAQVHV